MAVVQSPEVVNRTASRGWRRELFLSFATICLSCGVPVVRADDWVSPPSLEDVPLRSPDLFVDHVAPAPIVVPLPSGMETGALCLAGMAAARWWKRKR